MLRPLEFHWILLGFQERRAPIAASVARHGLVNFHPVRVTHVGGNSFESTFLWNAFPNVEGRLLAGSNFRFQYGACGHPLGQIPYRESTLYMTRLDDIPITGIQAAKDLEDGDILLLTHRREELPEPELR